MANRFWTALLPTLAAATLIAGSAAAAPDAVPASEIGGAKVGMIYSEVRKRILASGYKPVAARQTSSAATMSPASYPRLRLAPARVRGSAATPFGREAGASRSTASAPRKAGRKIKRSSALSS